MATQTASSSSSSRKYDVFLSFCGGDTRKNFTDHLHTALKQKGIITFRDDEKLERGKYISEELLKAIEQSDYAIIVLSKNYAFSRWCLIELAKIVECTKKTGLIVFPVFYHVDPSDVRNQTGTLGEAFTKHEKDPRVNIDDIQAWKAALIKVGNTSGWHLHDGHESKVIEEMVGKILSKLTSTYSNFHKDLVGINSRMEELVNLLGMGLSDVRFIGIWGMGGMGKTTLAQVVYDRFHGYFEGSSFLANVREESGQQGLVYLQKRLLFNILGEKNFDFPDFRWGTNVIKKRLCHKKVLIILDDVDQPDQLEALVREQSWFGQGSRIIITTRDKHVLIKHEVAKAQIYKVKEMNNYEALKLFSQKAFKKDQPLKAYVEMSQKFIYYAKGLPLALEVLGSFLRHRDLNLWESTLARYKENPPKKILDVLEISFDGLEEREKDIYLDIACFFNGKDRGYVTKLLQILYDKPDIDIDVLLKKSLVTISWRYFQMHDLLQELGREIVRRESPQEAGERSRLWHSEDVCHVLKENTGTNSVKGIFLESPPKKERHLNVEAFPKMKNLRLLKISNVHLPQGLNYLYLSSELRSIHWAGYPLESLPTSFEPEKLVELIMRSSLIKQLWEGFKSCDKLKHIDLSDSINLIEIPDLSGVPNLEQLILQGCTTLHRIHESLGNLKRLIQLDLENCKCLERLPHKINLESLEIFNLSGCSKLIKFPKIVGNMSHLSEIYLCKTAIKASSLPMEHLTSVTELNLSDCKDLDELPKNLGNMKGLAELDVSRTAIKELPSSIIQLSNLKGLLLCGCTSLQSLPELPLNLGQLILQGCTSLSKIHASLGNLKLLIRLDLDGCKCLESLPHKINLEALKTFILSGCSRLKKFPEVVGNMSCLSKLSLNETAITSLPLSIEHLIGLIKLDLRDCKNLSSLPNGCYSSMSLKSLNLSGCSKLVKLPENLGNIKTLEELDVSGTAITGLPLSIEHLIGLIKLNIRDCKNLSSLPNCCYSSMSLKILNLSGCSKLNELPKNLGKIEGLKELDLSGTAITKIVGNMSHLSKLYLCKTAIKASSLPVEHLTSVTELNLSDCKDLDELPKNLGNMKGLAELDVSRTAIKELPSSIIQLSNLKGLLLCGCTSLQSLPELPLNLGQLILHGCTSLSKIHASLGNLKLLIRLDLDGCKCLESLPHKISLEALKTFILSGCSRLKKFPEVVGNMSCLSKLSLNETAITGLPLSIEHLIGLIKLDLRDCKNLSSLPNGCYSSMSLKSLNLSGCSKLAELPENLGKIESLEELDLSRTAITGLPLSIEHLIGLIKLDLRDCKNLSSLPNGCYSSMSLKSLNLSGCSKLAELPENLGKIESLEELDLSRTAITGLPSFVVHLKNLKKLSLSGCVGPSSRRSPDPMGMLERSLIGLCSLTELDLSHCNVQTIPNTLGCLSSLEHLNLRGNNFVCLPESIIQLSNLRHLFIGGCTHLRMLPELPLNIEYINATQCTSLETLSLRPEYNFQPAFRLLNCDKLIKNQGYGDLFSTMLRRYLVNHQGPKDVYFHVEIPGSEIPKWFSHQNVGASVNLQVPSNSLGNESMGIIVCAVFVFHQHLPLHQHYLQCSVGGFPCFTRILSEEFGKIESYQLWLHYFGPNRVKTLNQVDANGFSQIEVKFKALGPGLEVTKCGAHLVFERDIEDLINQTKARPSSCIITPYDQDSEKDTKIKRSRADSDGEGAGPSGEATSNDVDEPHPKRVRLPDLTERLIPRLGNWLGNSSTQEQGDSDCEEEKSQ